MTSALLPGSSDTIVAQATAGARSALAIVRLSGPESHHIGAMLLRPWHSKPRQAYLATLHDPVTMRDVDQGIITVYSAPASYTGEDMIELSLHGGDVGPALAIIALVEAGARQALPGELTRRALLNGKLDLVQAEAIADLVDARSSAMHTVALNQLTGHLSSWLNALQNSLIELEALVAYDVDFPEEDDGPIEPNRLSHLSREVLNTLDALLATARTGEMIRRGAHVVIAGAPNTGKSSLFNALIGMQRAIVTDVPGTTRDALEVMIDIESWPVRLVDTAGLRVSLDPVEQLGIEVAEQHVTNAMIVLVCGENEGLLEAAIERVKDLGTATLIAVRTKNDIAKCPIESDLFHGVRHIPVSAHTGDGLAELARVIAQALNLECRPPSVHNPMLTRERHRVALAKARTELVAFTETFEGENRVPTIISAVHLHAARGHLDELVGALDKEDVLDRIFSNFCVGK